MGLLSKIKKRIEGKDEAPPPASEPEVEDDTPGEGEKGKLTSRLAEMKAKAASKGVNPPDGDNVPEEEKEPEAAEKKPTTRKKGKKARSTKAPRVLYVNCYPVKGGPDVVHLSDIVAGFRTELNEALDVPHWRLAEFGAGAGALAAGFEDWISGDGKGCEALHIDTRAPEGQAVYEVAVAHFDLVVRGI